MGRKGSSAEAKASTRASRRTQPEVEEAEPRSPTGMEAAMDVEEAGTSDAAAPPSRKRGHRRPAATTSASKPTASAAAAAHGPNPLSVLGRRLLEGVQAVADEAALKLAESELPVRHYNEKKKLLDYYAQSFQDWRLQLRQGFSLVFYGLGSKLKLLESFAEAALTDGGVLAANGFHSRLSAKQVVVAAASTYFGKSCRGVNPSELLAQLARESGERSLYLLLHNIDGPGLQSSQDQLLLAELSSCRCIHLVCSMEHVNAPLLWDAQHSRLFNWLWHHTPTYQLRALEAMDTPSILDGWGQQSRRRGASSVLHSLVPNARHVFRVMGQVQLDDPGCEGLPFAHWYRLCRERFLVASEQALRGHLTEFRDHELIKTRTNCEGLEVLYIPLDAEPLSTMLQELETMD